MSKHGLGLILEKVLLIILLCVWATAFMVGSFVGSNTYSEPVLKANLGEAGHHEPPSRELTSTCVCESESDCVCTQSFMHRFVFKVGSKEPLPSEQQLFCEKDKVTMVVPPKLPGPGDTMKELWKRLFNIGLSWTWTNILLLCCCSSLIGELASARITNYQTAIARAFFIYIFLISGQLIFAGEIFFNVTEPSAYFRIASIASIFGFLVGFNPDFFTNSIKQFVGKVDSAAVGKVSAAAIVTVDTAAAGAVGDVEEALVEVEPQPGK